MSDLDAMSLATGGGVAAPVRVSVRPSLSITAFLGVAHGVALMVGWWTLPRVAAAVIAAGLLLSLVVQLRKERAKNFVVIVIDSDGAMWVEAPGGAPRPVVTGRLIGTALITLRAAPPGPWVTGDLLLAPDSAEPAGLRALRRAILMLVNDGTAAAPPQAS